MTKFIVLSVTATAAVSAPGPQCVQLAGFSPLPVNEVAVNDNRRSATPPATLRNPVLDRAI